MKFSLFQLLQMLLFNIWSSVLENAVLKTSTPVLDHKCFGFELKRLAYWSFPGPLYAWWNWPLQILKSIESEASDILDCD